MLFSLKTASKDDISEKEWWLKLRDFNTDNWWLATEDCLWLMTGNWQLVTTGNYWQLLVTTDDYCTVCCHEDIPKFQNLMKGIPYENSGPCKE